MVERLSRRALWMHKLSDEVVKGLTKRIRSGELAPGAPIGTREEIAGTFVTSLAVVDRALETLLGQRLVERGPAGLLMVPTVLPAERAFEVSTAESLDDIVQILELRLGVESIGASLAAARHDAASVEAIQAAAAAYERAAETGEAAGRADFLFHRTIAEASGNRYVLDLLEYLGPLLIPRMRDVLPPAAAGGPDPNMRQSIEEHRRIAEAIAAGSPEAAQDAMDAHLTRTISLIRTLEAERIGS